MTPFVSATNHQVPFAGPKDETVEETLARLKPISDAMYGYTSGKVEPVVHIIEPEKDWVVRNSYGSLIWVSTHVPILDIDLDEDEDDCGTTVHDLSASGARRSLANQIARYMKDLKWDYRLYSTCSGFRVILTNYEAEETTFSELAVFWNAISGLPIDRNYKDLCIKQKCFRARLSTKPWRSDDSISVVNSINDTELENYRYSVNAGVGITRVVRSPLNALSDNDAINFHDILTGAESSNVEVLQ